MIRISWQLALLVAVCIAIVARAPRLLFPVLLVFGVWLAWQATRRPRR